MEKKYLDMLLHSFVMSKGYLITKMQVKVTPSQMTRTRNTVKHIHKIQDKFKPKCWTSRTVGIMVSNVTRSIPVSASVSLCYISLVIQMFVSADFSLHMLGFLSVLFCSTVLVSHTGR